MHNQFLSDAQKRILSKEDKAQKRAVKSKKRKRKKKNLTPLSKDEWRLWRALREEGLFFKTKISVQGVQVGFLIGDLRIEIDKDAEPLRNIETIVFFSDELNDINDVIRRIKSMINPEAYKRMIWRG